MFVVAEKYSLRPENYIRVCDALSLVYFLCHNECRSLRIDSDRLKDHQICSHVVLCLYQRETQAIDLCFVELLKPGSWKETNRFLVRDYENK